MFKFWKYSSFTLSPKHAESLCNILLCQGTVGLGKCALCAKPRHFILHLSCYISVPSSALWLVRSLMVLLSLCLVPIAALPSLWTCMTAFNTLSQAFPLPSRFSLHPCFPMTATFDMNTSPFWVKMISKDSFWFPSLKHLILCNFAYPFLLCPPQKEVSLCVLGETNLTQ